MMANWLAVSGHVHCGIFQYFSILRKARNSNFFAVSSLGSGRDSWRSSKAHMQTHYGVGRIDIRAYLGRIGKERDDLLPLAATVGNLVPHGSCANSSSATAARSALAAR